MNELAKKLISEARVKKSITQTEMAEKLGIELGQTYSLRQYQKIESGIAPKFKKEVIVAIDKLLEINSYELFYEQKNTSNPTSSLIEVDFRIKYIEAVERESARLYNIIQTNLTQIAQDAGLVLAYQKAWVDYVADKDSKGSETKKIELQAKMGKLVGDNLQVVSKGGSSVSQDS